jgi:hemin uptake protein HemP
VHSDALFGGAAQLAIVHERTTYILRKTRLGKLILTK